MNVVVLSPHFPPNFARFSTCLRAAGANVLGIGDLPFEYLTQELRDNLTYYYRVHHMQNWDELCAAMHFFQDKFGKIDRLDSHSEFWLGYEAGLRSDFQIEGITREQIDRVKRKSLMKQTFLDAGLNPARGKVCYNAEETRAFIAEVGYPVVAKPDVGVGAAATYRLDNESELERYLTQKPEVDYIVEEYIDAQVVTFDGLVDKNGDAIFTSQMVYSQGVMDVVNFDTNIYYYTLREIHSQLMQAGLATVKAFDVRERFFHFEFFLMSDGSVRPMEVNMRPPGGFTMDVWNYMFDFDAYKIWAEMLVQGKSPRFSDRKYFVNYIGRKDYFNYQLQRDEIYERFGSLIMMEGRMPEAFSRALGNSFFIARSPKLQPLIDAANEIQALIV